MGRNDDLGQLIREDNRALNKSYVYTYDYAGNITSKKEYAFTTGTLGSVTKPITIVMRTLLGAISSQALTATRLPTIKSVIPRELARTVQPKSVGPKQPITLGTVVSFSAFSRWTA